MTYISRMVHAFLDGFLPVFGLLAFMAGGWYIYTQSADEFLQLPLIQEITDTYQRGWEETLRLSDALAERVITLQQAEQFAASEEYEPALSLEIPWHWSIVEEKLKNEGWSSGKMKAAYAYLAYIDQYLEEAVRDMHETGVSASITLAQGILESDAGRSNLATTTNNHFGIKAPPNKAGRGKIKRKAFSQLSDQDFTYRKPAIGVSRHHDDHKYDRFEVYRSVADSYRRHSALLQNTCKKARKGCYAWIWTAFSPRKQRYDLTEMAEVFQPVSGIAPIDFFGETVVPYYAAQAAGLKMAGYATSKTYHKKLVYLIETYELWRIDAALAQATSEEFHYAE